MRGNPGRGHRWPTRSLAIGVIPVATIGCLLLGGAAAVSTTRAQTLQSDGSVKLSGRTVRCGSVRTVMDASLPSEGAAAPGRLLLLNPRLLRQHTEIVRLFVFHHECGHHHVGASELAADCYGVEQGVQQGWLDKTGLREVCESFDDAPETPTHPSGRRRCRNLEVCYAKAVAAQKQQQPNTGITTASIAQPARSAPAPRLLSGPTLVSIGTLRPAAARNAARNSAPCGTASAGDRKPGDPIGELIEKAGCR